MKRKVLIAGALGVVGRAAVEHFSSNSDADIIGLSRRKPDFATRAEFISVDLRQKADCLTLLKNNPDVTHVVYAALHEQGAIVSGWTEQEHLKINLQMLANLLDSVEETASNFQHITLLQGGKAYGVHLGPPPDIPSRESDGRTMPPNFYFAQEDYVSRRQQGRSWAWTVLRPPAVCGFAVGSPMNMLLATGIFAAISRELGLPLRFSGALGHLKDFCDAKLLAKAIDWAGTSPTARNEIFNIANGDCFTWEALFPRVAEAFSMPLGRPHSLSLSRIMDDKAEVWARIVSKHDLRPYSLSELIPAWDYADFTYRYNQHPFHSLLSTIKIRQAGFSDCCDSEQAFLQALKDLQATRILPS